MSREKGGNVWNSGYNDWKWETTSNKSVKDWLFVLKK